MRLEYYFALVATLWLTTVYAASEKFGLKLTGPNELKGMMIYEDGSSLFIGKHSGDIIEGTIQEDGSLKLGTGEFIGINKNYLTLTTNYTQYATPFGINGDGYLTLYGEKEFKAIPSGQTDIWILASNNAVSTLDSVHTTKVKCVDSDGKKVNKFTVNGSSASKLLNKTELLAVLFFSFSAYVLF